jgi:hypothetical protein
MWMKRDRNIASLFPNQAQKQKAPSFGERFIRYLGAKN